MSILLDKLFENRGYSDNYIKEISDSTHNMLLDCDKLANELKVIHDSQELIVVLPDFDVDGISSGTIGLAGLAELGFNVGLYVPDPSEGYGFGPKTIDTIIRTYPGVKHIITCDTGITCYEGVSHATALGIHMLITDHHVQENNANMLRMRNEAKVIVNPKRLDETYEHPSICGAFVLYQCLEYYAMKYESNFYVEQIRRLRVFAGIGTVSDMMPVVYENRKVLKDAINICRFIYSNGDDSIVKYISGCDTYRRVFWGLFRALAGFAQMGEIACSEDINEEFFGYYFAPCFNSVKRMDGDMNRTFGVFFGNDPARDFDYLYELNTRRKNLTKKYLNEINSSEQPYAPYIYISDCSAGIAGLLAGNLIKITGLPTIVVSGSPDGTFSGSGRSPEWYTFLDRTKDVIYAAGHNPAFGVGFKDEADIRQAFEFLNTDVNVVLSHTVLEDVKPDFVISMLGDGDIGIDIITFAEFLTEIESLKPFGKGFEKPLGRLRFKAGSCTYKTIGSANQHLKLTLPMGFEVLLWNAAGEKHRLKNPDAIIQIDGGLSMNEFRGIHTVNFVGNFVD